jgi:broad specificity phosphatase PhoE
MRLLLIRHGHVEGIDPPRFRGKVDLPLTELGARQARATARRIASEWPVDRIVSSPLGRSATTAQAIADVTGGHVETSEAFLDFNYGDWSQELVEDVRRRDPDAVRRWFSAPHLFRAPGGDSLQDVASRAADGLRALLESNPESTVVVVGHDSVNRVLLTQLLDLPLSAYWRLAQGPACINEVIIEPTAAQVVRVNETGHLRDRDSPAT